jgi:hypothetical protein
MLYAPVGKLGNDESGKMTWFLRRRLKCEMLMDGRRTKSDDKKKVRTKFRTHAICFVCM